MGAHIEWFRGGETRDEGRLAGEAAFVWSDTRWSEETQLGDRAIYLQAIGTNGEFKFPANGLRISDANNRQEDPSVWPASDGGWFIAWEDFDADSFGNIYCNKIDENGIRLWTNDERGIPVCVDTNKTQGETRIVEDGDGGCIIAWLDCRSGDIGDLYAMHILSDGLPDPRWPKNGMAVVVAPSAQIFHTADTDGAGGMIIGWQDERELQNTDIWAQRITPNGELLWGEGIQVCGHEANQVTPKLCPDGSGGAFFTWVDGRNPPESNKDIYAQRVDENGNLMWDGDGEPICTNRLEQLDQRIVASWPGEAIVVWEDERADSLTYDIYSMRISGDDHLLKLWNQEQGVPVVIADDQQKEVRLYPDGQGGAYYVWYDARNAAFPEVDIWAQRMDRQGQPVWQENGVPVCTTRSTQQSPVARRIADGGCVIVWEDQRSGAKEIYAQRLRPQDGQAVWQENGRPVVEGIGSNARVPKVISHDNNTYTVYWTDGRFAQIGDPFIQYMRDLGGSVETMLDTNGIPVITGTVGGGILPDAVPDGQGGTIIVWEDHRSHDWYSIYAQLITPDGVRHWGQTGRKVAEWDGEQKNPRICIDGEGNIFVAWKAETPALYSNIFMQRLDHNGNRLWGDEGIRITDRELNDNMAELVPDNEGGAVLLWEVNSSLNPPSAQDLWATRVDNDGTQVWGDGEGIVVCDAYRIQRDARMVRHQNGFVVVWVDERDDELGQVQNDIFGQFIGMDGNIRWRENGSIICADERNQDFPDVTVDNDTYIWVVWEDNRYTVTRKRDIFIQKINPAPGQGSRVWRLFPELEGRVICAAEEGQETPQIVHDGRNGVWVVWKDRRPGVWSDIWGTHLQPDGWPYAPWDPLGNIICGAYHKQELPQIARLRMCGETGIVAVWEDKRATGKDELFNVYTQRIDDDMVFVGRGARHTPAGFELEEAFPNPFNPQTIIGFTIPKSAIRNPQSVIRLSVYDISGRLVTTLAQGSFSPGRHQVVIRGDELAAGTYFVRLESGEVRLERPIHLVK